MKQGDKIVLMTVIMLVLGDIIFTVIYLIVPPQWQMMVLLQAVIWSATTSIGALFWSLRIAREVFNRADEVKEGVKRIKEFIGE
jgi:predicted MFS family arabinose efflux permease